VRSFLHALILFADNDAPPLARSFAGDAIDFDAIETCRRKLKFAFVI
jgi:hypothetical protein